MKKTSAYRTVTLALLIIVNIGSFFTTRQFSIQHLNTNKHDSNNVCNVTSCGCITPGPSELRDVVPMDILKEHVMIDSIHGLRNLDHAALIRYYKCNPRVKPTQKLDHIYWCNKRKFATNKLPLVALVSFHGSGNTWFRYLLEQSTGVFTGSIYCDEILKATFPGESVISKNVIVVKTHRADTRAMPKDVQLNLKKELYDKAIILVRDPFDALLSEANRRWNSNLILNSHIGLASETSFVVPNGIGLWSTKEQHGHISFTHGYLKMTHKFL